MQDIGIGYDSYWSSSPHSSQNSKAWELSIDDNTIRKAQSMNRSANGKVRCFKDSSSEPQTLEYRWQTSSTCSPNSSDYTSVQLNPYSA